VPVPGAVPETRAWLLIIDLKLPHLFFFPVSCILALPECDCFPEIFSCCKMLFKSLALAACASCALAHGNHDQTPVSGPHKSLWYNTLPGDGGTQVR
jgi:hypothetical protein